MRWRIEINAQRARTIQCTCPFSLPMLYHSHVDIQCCWFMYNFQLFHPTYINVFVCDDIVYILAIHVTCTGRVKDCSACGRNLVYFQQLDASETKNLETSLKGFLKKGETMQMTVNVRSIRVLGSCYMSCTSIYNLGSRITV